MACVVVYMCSMFCVDEVYWPYILLTIDEFLILYPLLKIISAALKIFSTFLFALISQTKSIVNMNEIFRCDLNISVMAVHERVFPQPFPGYQPMRSVIRDFYKYNYYFHHTAIWKSLLYIFGKNLEQPYITFSEYNSTGIHKNIHNCAVDFWLS